MNRAAAALLRLSSSAATSRMASSTKFSRFTALSPVLQARTEQLRSMGTSLSEIDNAEKTFRKSCYFQMDFTISEDATVYEAVQKFAAFDIGALVTTDSNGEKNCVVCLWEQ